MSGVAEVRDAVSNWMENKKSIFDLGLPEWDDRLDVWRVALLSPINRQHSVGEVRVSSSLTVMWSSDLDLAKIRCIKNGAKPKTHKNKNKQITFRPIPSRLVFGDARDVLAEYPPGSIQLVFTSPPYFNAKPECHESLGYEAYLENMRDVFTKCHNVLSEGRFLVVNSSPI